MRMTPGKIFILLLIAAIVSSQRFDIPSSSSRSPGLQVDGDGKIYTAAGSQLYRLNSNLVLEERRVLSSEAVNISLSSDGRWLVVCLTDLSCEVYNANNFSAGYVFRRENTILSAENIALFAAEDSFYVGGITVTGGRQSEIVLGQYGGFGRNQASVASRSYNIDASINFVRNFYGSGFIRGNNTYYFAVNNDPSNVRSLKVMRVCHNSDFGALYELALTCGIRTPISSTRISGVTVVDSFAGMSGPTVVLSISRPLPSSLNLVCLYSLDAIDGRMQDKLDSCATATILAEQIELSWRIEEPPCITEFSLTDSCHFGNTPPALDDLDNSSFPLGGDVRIDLSRPRANFITASAAAIVESFLLVFVGYTDGNGVSYISGFAIKNTTTSALNEDQGFDNQIISDGPVRQIQIQSELGMVYAVTSASVIQFPIADCAHLLDCTSCLGNGNPLCGWCVVENKCSRTSECKNSGDSARWIQAARTNADRCPTITVSPEQYVPDNPQTIALTVSRDLPMLQENETYFCHFAGNGRILTVPAVGSGPNYMCNITDSIPTQFEGLATELNVSLVSSSEGIPFSTNVGGLTIIRCSDTSSCSQCLQTNNACGWCVYNKVCSATSAPCLSLNGTDTFLQLNLAMGETFTDVCPLLDQPSPGMNYQQPVQVNQDIELVTRNLPPEISDLDYMYMCHVHGINLQATYNNETSLTCSVDLNTLTLPDGVGQQSVDVTIRWVRLNTNIDHPIDAVTPVSVILYDCAEVADSCSTCLGSEFECRWCGTPNQPAGSCAYSGPGGVCDNAMPITMGSDCAAPRISDFNPKNGPPEGGTTITIMGTDLGISFSDFTAPGSSIQVGDVTCTPTNPDSYMPGRMISCITTSSGGSVGPMSINITLPNGAGISSVQFNIISPRISGVFPPRGPQAGGTHLTVRGTNLDIGNIEDTSITVVGIPCTVIRGSILATSINCTSMVFTDSDPPVSGAVMVMIDGATASDSSVQYSYIPNPEFYNVIPSTTILGGGIVLTFNGTNLDVVQNPMLVITDPQYLNEANSTRCTVINSTAISCVTPPLNRIQPGDVDGITYTILVDAASGPDPQANVSLQIRVLPNPGSFRLIDSVYTTQDIETSSPIRIEGENLDSLNMDFYSVAVGGGSCSITFIVDTQINCVPPANPPGGIAEATVTVFVGEYLIYTLDNKLVYDINNIIIDNPNPSNLSTIIPAILVPLLVVIIALVALIVGIFYFNVIRTKRTLNLEMIGEGGESKANTVAMSSLLQSSNLQIMQEELIKQVPKTFIIPSSQLQLVHNQTIGQGEFGIVYKAQLINWQGHRLPLPVAVKTLKGLFTASDVESMLEEIIKMKDLRHPNVMTLIGVCLDAGPGVSIVMPFMANGSLLEYLKKDRDKIYLPDTSELEDVLSVRKLLLRMCHQVAKGMEYLALNKFVHRDLAARNCMLNNSGIVKVGDFGLAEDVYTTGYFRQGKDDAVKLPFKWMAPESLRDGLFSEKSDVWSFGITCWEVFSGGRIPYSGVDAMRMLKILEKGTRLEKPDNAACAPEIYSIIVKCWALNPEDRPDFNQLEGKIGKLLKLIADYMELSMELLPTEESEELSGYEIIENPETGEPTETEAIEDKPASGAANSGYDMTENSAYRAAGTQSSSNGNAGAGAPPTENKPVSEASSSVGTATVKVKGSDADGGGAATVNFDMTSNTAYSATSYN